MLTALLKDWLSAPYGDIVYSMWQRVHSLLPKSSFHPLGQRNPPEIREEHFISTDGISTGDMQTAPLPQEYPVWGQADWHKTSYPCCLLMFTDKLFFLPFLHNAPFSKATQRGTSLDAQAAGCWLSKVGRNLLWLKYKILSYYERSTLYI